MLKYNVYPVVFVFILNINGLIYTENFVTNWVRNKVTESFGIDAHAPLINEPFYPTIENLNTITLTPCGEAMADKLMSVSEIAHTIDTKEFTDALYLQLSTEQQEEILRIDQGLHIENPQDAVFVYSRGYAGADHPEKPKKKGEKRKPRGMCAIPKRGGSVVVGAQWLKNHVINGTCIMFDYPDTRSFFDFGLNNDRNCLDTIYGALSQKTQNIVLFGNCRGSKALLNFLSHSCPQHIRAVVLDAPFLDLVQFTQEIGKSYGKRIPFSKDIAYKVITYWHPSYRLEDDLTIDDLKNIPQHIPIFIGHLYHDALVSDQLIKDAVKTLRDSGHTVYLLVIDDKDRSHSRLYQTEPFAKAVNAFLKEYNLPHDTKLAHDGRFLLNYAMHNTRNIDNWHNEGFPYIYKNA